MEQPFNSLHLQPQAGHTKRDNKTAQTKNDYN